MSPPRHLSQRRTAPTSHVDDIINKYDAWEESQGMNRVMRDYDRAARPSDGRVNRKRRCACCGVLIIARFFSSFGTHACARAPFREANNCNTVWGQPTYTACVRALCLKSDDFRALSSDCTQYEVRRQPRMDVMATHQARNGFKPGRIRCVDRGQLAQSRAGTFK